MNRRTPSARFRPTLSLLEARDNPASLFIATGAAAGGLPLVEVDRPDGTPLALFPAFETSFTGGVRAAAGELDGDANTVEVVAAPGPTGGPRIRVFSVNTVTGAVTILTDEFVFEPSFRDGVRVAVGRIGGGALDQIALGTDPGGGPRVRTLRLDLSGAAPTLVPAGGPLSDFFAFESGFRGGVRVAVGDVDGNPSNGDELVAGAGPGGTPRVIVFRADGTTAADFFAGPPELTGGVNVSVINGQLFADGLPADVSQRNAALNAVAVPVAPVPPVVVAPTPTPPLQTGNPAPGFEFNLPFAAPGLVIGNPAALPLLTTTPATFGLPFGTAATAPGVFGATAGVPFGTAITAGGVFDTAGFAPLVTFSSMTTISGGVFSTTSFPVIVSSAATAPGIFGTTSFPVGFGTAATAGGVFSTVGGPGVIGF